jgi:hypothetical protein
MVPDMDEAFIPYTITIAVPCADGRPLDADAFAAAASRAAWRRSASVVSARAGGRLIAAVTVDAPGRYAATAVARAVVADALRSCASAAGPAARPLAA